MPIETPSGVLEVENAKLRASSIEATIAVGIGTESNDAYPLQVFKETEPDIRIQEGSTISSASRIYSNNSNLYIQTGSDFTYGSSGDVAFQNMQGALTHMVIKGDGNVGIGTGSPGSKLHVYDGTAVSLIVEGGNNTIGTDTAQIILRNKIARRAGLEFQDDSDNSRIWHIGRSYRGGSASTKLSFSNVNNDEVMTITNAGNVGIGTVSPASKLSVFGPDQVDSFDSQCTLASNSTTGAINGGGVLQFEGYDGANLRGFATVSGLKENGTSGNYASYLRFSTRTNGVSSITERMRITSTGNVGIGTSSPTVTLDVNGVTKNQNPSWNLYMLGSNPTSVLSGTLEFNNIRVSARNCTLNTSGGLTSRVTITVPGRYFIGFNSFTEFDVAQGTGVANEIRINGGNYARTYHVQPVTNYSAMGGLGCLADLSANDYVEIYSSEDVHFNANASFYGFMIG